MKASASRCREMSSWRILKDSIPNLSTFFMPLFCKNPLVLGPLAAILARSDGYASGDGLCLVAPALLGALASFSRRTPSKPFISARFNGFLSKELPTLPYLVLRIEIVGKVFSFSALLKRFAPLDSSITRKNALP